MSWLRDLTRPDRHALQLNFNVVNWNIVWIRGDSATKFKTKITVSSSFMALLSASTSSSSCDRCKMEWENFSIFFFCAENTKFKMTISKWNHLSHAIGNLKCNCLVETMYECTLYGYVNCKWKRRNENRIHIEHVVYRHFGECFWNEIGEDFRFLFLASPFFCFIFLISVACRPRKFHFLRYHHCKSMSIR